MYGLSSDVRPWVPEESRLRMQVVFVIHGLAIVPKVCVLPHILASISTRKS